MTISYHHSRRVQGDSVKQKGFCGLFFLGGLTCILRRLLLDDFLFLSKWVRCSVKLKLTI